jgi:hypothetical protein
MREGAHMAMVIGQSETRIGVLGSIRDAARSMGLQLDLDMNRTVTSQRRQAPSITGEHVMLFAK